MSLGRWRVSRLQQDKTQRRVEGLWRPRDFSVLLDLPEMLGDPAALGDRDSMRLCTEDAPEYLLDIS